MMEKIQLNVAYVGSYDPLYTRVRTVLKGLRKQGVNVIECRNKNPYKLLRLAIIAIKYLLIAYKVDALIVSEAGHAYVPLAKILSLITRKPLIFDAFLSYYHVKVVDTKSVPTNSLKGKYFYYLDKISCLLADIVLLDTQEHAEYFHKTFNISLNKFRILPVGSDDEWFSPTQENVSKKNFNVFLVTSFFPVHGVEYVIKAAKLLENEQNIKFLIVGDGMTRPYIESLKEKLEVKNVIIKGITPSYLLPELMSQASVCLGQFGNTQHAQLVIPAKVYDALAMKKPVITGNGMAIKQILTDKENVIFCSFADPLAIAEAILSLKNDNNLRIRIAENGYNLFKSQYSLDFIGKQLIEIIKEFI